MLILHFFLVGHEGIGKSDESVLARIRASSWFAGKENNDCTPNTYLLLAECEVRTASYGTSSFPSFYGPPGRGKKNKDS